MNRIDSFPTHKIGSLEYCAGRVFPFGATITDGGVNFSIFSKDATSCTLLLYNRGEKNPFCEIEFLPEFRIGNVFSIMVFGINVENTEYGYKFDGIHAPEKGYVYDKNKPLLDPYAKSVSGRNIWGTLPDPDNPFQHRGQLIYEDYDHRIFPIMNL